MTKRHILLTCLLAVLTALLTLTGAMADDEEKLTVSLDRNTMKQGDTLTITWEGNIPTVQMEIWVRDGWADGSANGKLLDQESMAVEPSGSYAFKLETEGAGGVEIRFSKRINEYESIIRGGWIKDVLVTDNPEVAENPLYKGKSGWFTEKGKRYYGDAYGFILTGIRAIGNSVYVLDDTGALQTGWVYAEIPEYGLANENGRYLNIQSGWYYTDPEDGALLTSLTGMKEITIPEKVTALSINYFRGADTSFVLKCKPGSFAEKLALKYGLQYDNGKKRAEGRNISDTDAKAEWVVNNYVTSAMSEREKVQALHNWVIYNATYDFTYSRHSARDILVDGTGVCEAYAAALNLLLEKAGIESRTLVGTEEMNHGWNLVRVDGQWYHLDATWDDPYVVGSSTSNSMISGGEGNYYFLKTDEEIGKDHSWSEDVSADANSVGWISLRGETYYYGKNGKRATGITEIPGTEYIYNEESGKYEPREITNSYFFDDKGAMQTGMQEYDGKRWYFQKDGRLFKNGWLQPETNGPRYYAGEDGSLATGIRKIGEDTYDFDDEGVMRTGIQEHDGKRWYFREDGRLAKDSWLQPEPDGPRYYAGEDGSLVTGFRKIGENTYYFDDNGEMQTGYKTIGERHYHFKDTGVMVTGWESDGDDGYFYYGEDGARCTGDVVIGEETYRFDEDGRLEGKVVETEDDSPEAAEDGQTRTEVVSVTLTEVGEEIELTAEDEPDNRVFLGFSGWEKIDGAWYYGDEDGYAVPGTAEADGTLYVFDERGVMRTGWVQVMDKWYYAEESGAACHGGWQEIGETWYYFRKNGEMAKDWVLDGGRYYYMNQDGTMATGWRQVENKWYCFGEDGAMQTGWVQSGEAWYYLRGNGAMATGWQEAGGRMYYFKQDGTMAANEWIEDKDGEAALPADEKRPLYYWFDENGCAATGWKEIDGRWEMFADSGEWLYSWAEGA